MIIQGDHYLNGPGGFERGYQATLFHSNMWVRGSATLDTDTGKLEIDFQLETDSVAYGPRGHIEVTIKDANGKALATAQTSQAGIGGKTPGPARIESGKNTVIIAKDKISNVKSMTVLPFYDGYVPLPFGLASFTISISFPTPQ